MNRLRFVAKALIHGAAELTGGPRRQRQQLRGSLIILTYHSFCTDWPSGLFASLPIDRFERQIRFLRENFKVVTLEHGLNCIQQGQSGDKPWVAITIDDGFVDNYTHAWPVLQRYGVPAAIFVATDFIDTGRSPWPIQIVEILDRTEALSMEFPFHADLRSHTARSAVLEKLKRVWAPLRPEERFSRLIELRKYLRVDHSSQYLPLSWDQARKMQGGGMTFGSHTVYHSIISETDSRVTKEEILHSKQRIEEELHVPCNFFAYPDGGHNAKAADAVKSAGYLGGLTQNRGHNTILTNPFLLDRLEVPYHDPMATFRARVSAYI
jgi:peptidoglycan/xylan/chitin deacetylase (PgdA/CDA1 family)